MAVPKRCAYCANVGLRYEQACEHRACRECLASMIEWHAGLPGATLRNLRCQVQGCPAMLESRVLMAHGRVGDVGRLQAGVLREGWRPMGGAPNAPGTPGTPGTPGAAARGEAECRYCEGPLPCGEAECGRLREQGCARQLPCGHRCYGVRGEAYHPNCLHPECAAADGRAGGGCAICRDPLRVLPALRIPGCAHIVHRDCLVAQLRGRWPGPHISFKFLGCPVCSAPLEGEFSPPLPELPPLLALRERVGRMGAEVAERQEELGEAAAYPGGLPAYVAAKYRFFACENCGEPYYGGRAECGAGAEPEEGGGPPPRLCVPCAEAREARLAQERARGAEAARREREAAERAAAAEAAGKQVLELERRGAPEARRMMDPRGRKALLAELGAAEAGWEAALVEAQVPGAGAQVRVVAADAAAAERAAAEVPGLADLEKGLGDARREYTAALEKVSAEINRALARDPRAELGPLMRRTELAERKRDLREGELHLAAGFAEEIPGAVGRLREGLLRGGQRYAAAAEGMLRERVMRREVEFLALQGLHQERARGRARDLESAGGELRQVLLEVHEAESRLEEELQAYFGALWRRAENRLAALRAALAAVARGAEVDLAALDAAQRERDAELHGAYRSRDANRVSDAYLRCPAYTVECRKACEALARGQPPKAEEVARAVHRELENLMPEANLEGLPEYLATKDPAQRAEMDRRAVARGRPTYAETAAARYRAAQDRRWCPRHGYAGIQYKCRWCCSPAAWFCFGDTHFCGKCHDRALSTKPLPCDPRTCPLGGMHPPNGEEYALGCGRCD